jgi:hypothetical protein
VRAERVIKVNGISVEIDTSQLTITDIDEAQRQSASQMAFWASVCGAAKREHAEAEAVYRQWRARQKMKILDRDSKVAEHKCNAEIESTNEFYELKQAIAICVDNVAVAEGMYGAWEKRVNAAQSLGSRERAEFEAGGKTTTKRTRKAPSDDEDDEADLDEGDDDSALDTPPRNLADAPDKKSKLKDILKKGKNDG